jgi:hypothetical protein
LRQRQAADAIALMVRPDRSERISKAGVAPERQGPP